MEKERTFFCSACLGHLALIESEERCPTCFAEDSPCKRCITRHVVIKRQAAACPSFGPACTLANYLGKGNTRFLPAAASLMALQFATLNWPLPDLIVPLPSSLWARCTKGADLATLLAKEVARLLDRPCAAPLRSSYDKHTFLEKAELRTRFVLQERKKKIITDKRVLLIALQLDDSQFRQAAEALQEGFASDSYALAFINSSVDKRQTLY